MEARLGLFDGSTLPLGRKRAGRASWEEGLAGKLEPLMRDGGWVITIKLSVNCSTTWQACSSLTVPLIL